jgi:ankyrin repeat protein
LIGVGIAVNARGLEDRTALHMAARHGHIEILRILIGEGADTHAIGNLRRAGYTPFHEAVSWGQVHVVRYLLAVDDNADHWVEARVASGATPLILASRHLTITKLLIRKGADIQSKDNNGDSPLHCATWETIRSMDMEIVSFLLKSGTDISAVNNEGVTPLSWAAQSPGLLSLCPTHLDPSNPGG